MKASELVSKLQNVVDNHKTLYVMGCFGAPMTSANVTRYINHHSYNQASARQKMMKAVADQNPPVFGFDCVCLIKGIMWGWTGDGSKSYGGASYAVNGVPDYSADGTIGICKNVSTDFSKIKIGSALWCSGHIGVYIGDGKAIECTPSFKNNVQVTVVTNIRAANSGENGRKWTKHGELPYIEYDVGNESEQQPPAPTIQPPTASSSIAVGDVVQFSGNTHYVSANATEGKPCGEGGAKVTQYSQGAKHPYHIIGDKSPCTAYGWVDADTLTKV